MSDGSGGGGVRNKKEEGGDEWQNSVGIGA